MALDFDTDRLEGVAGDAAQPVMDAQAERGRWQRSGRRGRGFRAASSFPEPHHGDMLGNMRHGFAEYRIMCGAKIRE
jgi:hypothetical protein